MTGHGRNRRSFLAATGVALATTMAAGCLGGDGDDGDGGDGSDGDDGGDGGNDYDDWMSDANNFDGAEDKTGEDEVRVEVGVGGNNYAYGPAGIEIDAGTTVVWEWTGDGGAHDVVENDGEFESDLLGDEGDEFEHTFDDAGTYTYYCTPHQGQGMKGVVVVE